MTEHVMVFIRRGGDYNGTTICRIGIFHPVQVYLAFQKETPSPHVRLNNGLNDHEEN
ncbi:1669_t:CDS:2 [Diversispora eburnea]|uniref:1669_t:CDS:1 n=1 Tax=Diversispora eburnea TaxID=1213867 RepID=A0A9N9ADH0_9GLOM|nr:1669_t:CDS:2 [Diversispora eburnea]